MAEKVAQMVVVDDAGLAKYYGVKPNVDNYPVGSEGPTGTGRSVKNDGSKVWFCKDASSGYCPICPLNGFTALCQSPVKSE